MAELDITQRSGELNAFPSVGSEQAPDEMQEYLAAVHSMRTNIPIADARLEIGSLGDDRFKEQSRADADEGLRNDVQQAAEIAVVGGSLEDVIAIEQDRSVRQEVIDTTQAPETLAETSLRTGEIWDRVSSIRASRESTVIKKLSEAQAGAGTGALNWFLDFADIVVSWPIDAIAGGGFERADMAQKIQIALTADISEKEFLVLLEEAIEVGRDAGAFTESNSLMLAGQIENIKQAGRGREAEIDSAFTVVDRITIPGLLSTVSRVALRTLRGARNTTSVISALRGVEAGGENLASALGAPGTTQATAAGIPAHTLPGYLRHPDSGVDTQRWSAPGFDKAARAERDNQFLDVMRNFGFSQRIDPDTFEAWRPTGVKILDQSLIATSRSNLLTMRIDPDGQGNIFGSILFGRRDNTPFTRKSDATKFANRHGGEVVPLTQGKTTAYVVEQVSNLPTKGIVKPLTADEIGNHFFGNFGSTFLSVPRRLETLAKRGEGVLNRVGKEIEPILNKAIKATSTEERRAVESVFWEMRDGDTLSNTRHALSPAEFRTEYMRITNGTAPTQAAEDMYNVIQELNDALYYLKADVVFKQANNEGAQILKVSVVDPDGRVIERDLTVSHVVDDLDADTIVYSPDTAVQTRAGDLKTSQQVFRVFGGMRVGEETAEFVTMSAPKLRRMFHTDVLGYNPGGVRSYEFINHGVGQPSTVRLMGKGEVPGRERILLGTATREEATRAVEQLNNILAEIRRKVPNLRALSQADATTALRGLDGDDELLEVILRNNDWDTSTESVADFIKLVESHVLDVRKNFGQKAMDDAFGVADDAGNLVFGARAGETMRSALESRLNPPRNGPRGDDPLIGMGGSSAPTVSPLDTIKRDLIRVTHERAFSAYNFQAVEGWLKGARKHIINKDEIDKLPPRQAMDKAEFPKSPDVEQRGYITARDAINRTLGNVSKHEQKWNNLVDRMAEFVYEKGFTTKKGLKGLPLRVLDAQQSKAPLTAIRGLAFHAKLGMMAFDQIFVQSAQIFNIMAIAPTKAWAGMAAAWPLRMTMINTSREFALEVGRRTAAFTGMPAEEFADFSRFWNESGRGLIGSEVGELGAVTYNTSKGFFKKAGNVSRVFFDEGERFPRAAAMHVAWKEYKEAFPKMDPFSNHGVNWITERQDVLTAAMTRVSAAPWQKGPLSITFQFQSYTSKMMESIFSDRLLSKAERGRLAAAQVAFWGASGTVFGGPVLDYFTTDGGLELDPDTLTLMRYGTLDWAIGATLGSDTAFGERLSVGEGLWRMFEDFSEQGMFETLGGPTAQVGSDVFSSLLDLMGDVTRGTTSMVEADLRKLMRDFTGPNKLYNAASIYYTGEYLSRNGAVIADGLTRTDALLAIIGAPLQEVSRTYTLIDTFESQDQWVRIRGNRVSEIMREMDTSIRDGDIEKAQEQGKLIAMLVATAPRWAQDRLRKAYEPNASSLLLRIIRKARERNQANTEIFRDKGE